MSDKAESKDKVGGPSFSWVQFVTAILLLLGASYAIFLRRGLSFDLTVVRMLIEHNVLIVIVGGAAGFVAALISHDHKVNVLKSTIVGAIIGVAAVLAYIAWDVDISIYPIIPPDSFKLLAPAISGSVVLVVMILLNRLAP